MEQALKIKHRSQDLYAEARRLFYIGDTGGAALNAASALETAELATELLTKAMSGVKSCQ